MRCIRILAEEWFVARPRPTDSLRAVMYAFSLWNHDVRKNANLRAERVSKRRSFGFTLVEILIVVVIMAILAAVIIPQFLGNIEETKVITARFNLSRLRAILEQYKCFHHGVPPKSLVELMRSTDDEGNIGIGPSYTFGPYLSVIPTNPLTRSDAVTAITNSPATSGDVTGNSGWLYNSKTGELWIDHLDYFQE